MREWVNRLNGLPAPSLGARLATPIAKSMANKVGADDARSRRNCGCCPSGSTGSMRCSRPGVIGGETFNAADLQVGCSVRA